jgi:outer membrane protein OmpA-like peptidoglycan-associated protein/phosphohistidine swiveling domain-containing protein
MVRHVSLFLGETPAQTQQAIDRAIPTHLAGLIHLSSLPNGPDRLLALITHDNYGRLLNNLSGLCDEGNTTHNVITTGQEILHRVFAEKLATVCALLAAASGVTNTSAAALLSLTAPVVVGVLGRVRAMQGLNAARLTTVLLDQQEAIRKLAPAGLAEVFAWPTRPHLGPELAGAATARTPDPVRRLTVGPAGDARALTRWRWPLLSAVVVGLLYFLWGRGAAVTPSSLVKPEPAAAPSVATVTLPDGAVLALQQGSCTYNVATFLGDHADTAVPKAFVCDRLKFDFGTTRLTADSVQTVTDLSAILKAYPTADVRLDGYTEGVGNMADNQRASVGRAVALKELLIRGGIAATRITTAGYGRETPMAANDTEDGRVRRLELVVVKK